MQEVVKKEIIKYFNEGVIYPIAYSNWIIPVQSYQKKLT